MLTMHEALLQWGRGFKTAERGVARGPSARVRGFNGAAVLKPRRGMSPPLASFGDTMLQWGRGFKTAERSVLLLVSKQVQCFNGAAVLKPRRGDLALAVALRLSASMGPRF